MGDAEICIVTGGGGLVGRGIEEILKLFKKTRVENNVRSVSDMKIIRCLEFQDFTQEENKDLLRRLDNMKFIFISTIDADLRDYASSKKIFEKYKPTCIIHLAAKVGGLFANIKDNINFFLENMRINENVLALCHEYKVRRGIFCLSTCVFPANASMPITEDMLHNGPPHESNEGYAMSKRMLEMLVRFYREEYEYEWLCVIPTNLYGKFDNFNLENGHVIPALIHKCFLSKKKNESLKVFGSGKALRQFLYNYDVAKILLKILVYPVENLFFTTIILAGDIKNGECTIATVAENIAKSMGLTTPIEYDKNKPEGIFRKTASNSVLRKFVGPNFEFTPIEEGIKDTVEWFVENYENCRK